MLWMASPSSVTGPVGYARTGVALRTRRKLTVSGSEQIGMPAGDPVVDESLEFAAAERRQLSRRREAVGVVGVSPERVVRRVVARPLVGGCPRSSSR
jgi:hypothetical protein